MLPLFYCFEINYYIIIHAKGNYAVTLVNLSE
jgi:hypothetical protein